MTLKFDLLRTIIFEWLMMGLLYFTYAFLVTRPFFGCQQTLCKVKFIVSMEPITKIVFYTFENLAEKQSASLKHGCLYQNHKVHDQWKKSDPNNYQGIIKSCTRLLKILLRMLISEMIFFLYRYNAFQWRLNVKCG